MAAATTARVNSEDLVMSRILAFARRRWTIAAAALVVAAATSTLAFEVARMRLPPELVAAERLPASGYGGRNRGRFALGDYRGDFTRIESRFAVFDPLYAANRGKSSFTLEGLGVDAPVAAECRFKERVVTVGVLTFDATKLAYVCEITDGSGAVGSLTLGEPKPSGFKERVLARAARRGLAEIGDLEITIDSVHHYERSKLSSQTPVGYVLTFDARPVGALELTDSNPTLLLAAGLEPELRRATLIAALGLSVLRDPANSALGD
jgi:hypothetical protein